MTPNLLTIPAIFVIAGVGLLIVAIIGELSIKEIRVPPLPRQGRILAAIAGMVFIGLGTLGPRDTTPPHASASSDDGPRREALINSPAEGATVPRKTVAIGTLRNALTAPASYWLLLQDDGGDYYPIEGSPDSRTARGKNRSRSGRHGNGRTARILLVEATSEDPLLSAASGLRRCLTHSAGRLANHHHAPPARPDPMTWRTCRRLRARTPRDPQALGADSEVRGSRALTHASLH